ncbi:MAG TPA: trypsin-like peptidase domain-containing protein [Solirubrobacterales bacterium]|nr:trypsin-like peptidase domain-containing protein [Solirubrobacterales bacterium]
MRARAAATSALLALALLSGCGSNGENSAETSTTTTSPPPPPRVVVQTSEDGFNAARVYREAAPGVVTIRSIFGAEEADSSDPFGGPSAAEGSGFVLDSSGHIVTNAHVVTDGGAGRKAASAVFVEFPDRNIVPAEIVGFDPFADVALLKVSPNGFDLHPLELGDDSELVVGQPVAAIGSPFGEQQSLSVGIVSATNRSVKSLTEFQIEGAIQTDASINPGNSGGPLLDAGARVIGINQQIETSSGANDGVGFAVPVSAVKRSVAQLKEDGKVEYAYIGVSSQALYPQLARRLGLDTEFGGLIAEVVSDGPADRAGLRGSDERVRFQAGAYETGGDVILSVNGREVVLPDDLARFISSYRPGEEVTLKVLRASGEVEDVQVTLGKRPSAVPSG